MLDEAKAALERGRPVVLVTPPAPERAGELWGLIPGTPEGRPWVSLPVLVICADQVSAGEWAASAPAGVRVHAVTGLARSARLLKEGRVEVLAGSATDLATLASQSVLKLEAVETAVVAWPETLVRGDQAAVLDTLLGAARDARRIVLSWNPASLGDFLERHARRALVVGALPVDADARPLPPVGAARYAVVAPDRRGAALRDATDALDPRRPFVWRGGAVEPPAEAPDAVFCTVLPTRPELAALARLGEPIVLLTAAQLPYLRSLVAPLAPLQLSRAPDRAADRAAALHERVTRLLADGDVDAELTLLAPLFQRFDPAEVAAALLALGRRAAAAGDAAPPGRGPTATGRTKVFVTVGKKDRAGAKDLVGALIREVGIDKAQIGRIDVRDTFSVVEVGADVAERVVRGLTGLTIKGRRAQARLDREGGA